MIASFAWRNLGRRRLRSSLGGLGIFCALALLTAVQAGLDSLSLSYLQLIELQTGKADVLITRARPEPFTMEAFDTSEVPAALTNSPELTPFSPRVQGLAVLQHRTGEHYAILVGADFSREAQLGFPTVPNSAPPGAKECLLSESLAGKLNIKKGSKIWVRAANNYSDVELQVADISKRQFLLPQEYKDYILVNLAAGQEVLGAPGQAHILAAAFKERRSIYDARNLHESVLRLKKLGSGLAIEATPKFELRMPKAAAITAFQEVTAPMKAFFGVLALLALCITGLLVYSLMAVAVEERIREFGILRTLGAGKQMVFSLVLTESVLLCLISAVPGVVAGLALAKGLVVIIGLLMGGSAGDFALDIRYRTLIGTLGAGVLMAVISAVIPAVSATRTRIVDALEPLRKGQLPPAAQGDSNRGLIVSGLVIASLAGIIFFVLPAALFSGSPSIIGSIILCLLLALLLGFTMACMGALPMLRRLMLAPLNWALEPVADLVRRNLDRHRRRHTTTSLLYTLSVALVLFVASLVALFSNSAVVWVDHSTGAHIRVYSPVAADPSLKATLQEITNVLDVSETRFLHNRSSEGTAYDVVIGDLIGMKQLWVVPFGVDSHLPAVINRELVRYHSGPKDALERLCAYQPDAAQTNQLPPVILSLAVARYLEVSAGDPVELSFRLGSQRKDGRFRVAAVCSSLPGFKNFRGRVALAVGSGLILPERVFTEMTTSAPETAFQKAYFLKCSGGTTGQKQVAKALRDNFDLRFRFGVESSAEQKEGAKVMYWATQVFFGLLLVATVVIAVFALIASMAVTVLERQHEIGILRALGLRQSHLFRLCYGEAAALTLAAGAAGGVVGFVLAWLFVVQAASLVELPVSFTMPYITFAATVLISLASGLLAAYIPAKSLMRKTTAEILRG